MDQIDHKYIDVRGLKLHVAELGAGPAVVVFLHGFPEIWYSWRNQMIAAAHAGLRAIAPDWRGYGLSESPSKPDKASFLDLVDDLLGILDSLAIPKAFLVAKDFGVLPAYDFALYHPERVSGVVTLGLPFIPPRSDGLRLDLFPKGFYILRWREPGRAEADFGRFDVKTVVRKIYVLFCRSELQVAGEDQEILDLVDPSTPLPTWFTEEDLAIYATLYEKSGFGYALQMPYRTLTETLSITDLKVQAPALLIMGTEDYVYKFPTMDEYINGNVKDYVPDLEVIFLPEGTHFVQEQSPDQVNRLIIDFVKKHTSSSTLTADK